MLKRPLMLVAGIAGAAMFLFLVKLMYDMAVQITRTTEQVTAMTGHMERIAGEVSGIREDVNGMRRSV